MGWVAWVRIEPLLKMRLGDAGRRGKNYAFGIWEKPHTLLNQEETPASYRLVHPYRSAAAVRAILMLQIHHAGYLATTWNKV